MKVPNERMTMRVGYTTIWIIILVRRLGWVYMPRDDQVKIEIKSNEWGDRVTFCAFVHQGQSRLIAKERT